MAQTPAIPFTFTLTDSLRSSAGVFTKDGTLLRTLWSGVTYGPGSHTRIWDGIDDEGQLVPDGAYIVKVLSNKVTYTWEGVIGNTSATKSGPTYIQAMENIASMAVAGNTAYYAVHYNEQKGSCFKVNTAYPKAKTDVLGKGAMVWLVATDGVNVYWGGADPNKSNNSFVFVTNTSDDSETKLTHATPVQTTYGRAYTSALSVVNQPNSRLSGLAVQKSGRFLFISRELMNTVYVLDKLTGALVTTVSTNAPRELAIDKDDNVWMISNKNTVQHYKVGVNGNLSADRTALAGLVDPLALGVSPDGATLIVADGGSSQQLKAYNSALGSSEWIFGQAGGYTVDPIVATDKFYFSDFRATRNPIAPSDTKFISTFVTFDPNGSFWVGDLGNNRVLHYTAARQYIDQLMYMTGSLNCSVDHNNPSRVFSDYLEFNVDYTKPLQPDNDSWTLVRNWGAVVPKEYDANIFIGRFRFITTLNNGRTYSVLCIKIAAGKYTFELVELPTTGPLRFTGVRFPDVNYQLYPDGSLWVQSLAELGKPITWHKKILTGFDVLNNPQWGELQPVASSPAFTPADPGFRGNPASLTAGEMTDSGVIVAFDGGRQPLGSDSWYHLGGIRAGSNTWLWRTARSTATQYTGDYPTDGAFDIGNGVNNAGSRALAMGRHIFWGYYGEFWKATQTNKWQHVYDNGLFVGQFGPTGRDGNLFELFPGMTGNAFSVNVIPSPIDSTAAYLYHNDDGWHSGVHRWKVSGLNTIREQAVPVVVRTQQPGLRADYFDGRDLDNVSLKTSRVETTLQANWPAGPAETALSDVANFSVRWQGFVQPTVPDAYTFYASANGKVRLWIDGKVVIDQWTNNALREFSTPVLNLEAGKRYSIRLEYSPTDKATQVAILWSGAKQPKQTIPTPQLVPAEATGSLDGVDLLAYLSPGKVLETTLYGWSRSPETEDYTNIYKQWWSAKTGIKSYGRERLASSDVWVKFVRSSGTYQVTRTISKNTEDVSWRLSGQIYYDGEDGNKPNGGVGYFDVLDDQSKVLTRLHVVNSYPTLSLYANNKLLAQMPRNDLLAILYRVQPLDIQVTDDKVIIKYGPFPALTTQIADSSANWRKPRTMRLFFKGDVDGSGHAFGFERMRFFTGKDTDDPGSNSSRLLVYPNPAQNQVVVQFPPATEAGYLDVISLTGQRLLNRPIIAGTTTVTVDVSVLSSSVYVLTYVSGSTRLSARLVKR